MTKRKNAFSAHFPSDVSAEIQDYATEEVLIESRYLFTRREGRRQYAYCTHCKREHESKGLKHGGVDGCPSCGTAAHVKASGRGRSTLIDAAYLLWYEKSLVDPQSTIIARGFYLQRDYTGDYRKTETFIKPIALYLFEWGAGGKMQNRNYWTKDGAWQDRKIVYSEATHAMKHRPCFWARHSVEAAVKGTPFQYCTWEHYDHEDRVKVFDLAARYKCIEFLTKIGLRGIVAAKLDGGQTFGAINWNGQTPEKVLRLNKAEIKAMRAAGAIGPRTLRHYQIVKKEGSELTWEETRDLSDLIENQYATELNQLTRYASVPVIKRYLVKQRRRENGKRYTSGHSALFTWRDYLNECRELGMDLQKDSVLFPNDLYGAHQITMQKVKVKHDQRLEDQIRDRLKVLRKFSCEYNGIFLRPAESGAELFEEGKKLKHCVGGYKARYANGDTDIFFIRRTEDPDTPFFTMEVSKGKIMQCHGFDNCNMTPEVKAFVDLFVSKKMLTKKRTRVDITGIQPAEREGVAI